MRKKAVVSVITLLLAFFLAQSLVFGAPTNPADTLITFTPRDLAVSPDHETLYLADGANTCLVAADLQTGQTQTLTLPYTPVKLVYAGAKIYVALSTPDNGSDSVAVVDLTTFTVASTISVDLDISGLAADTNYIYVYNASKIESFDTTGVKLSSLAINNLNDVKIHPSDGNLYATAYSGAMCLGSAAGQLSILKQNSSYAGSRITLLPDGKNLMLDSGVVLTCNADASKALVLTKKLQSSSSMCTDAINNELFAVVDRLIQVYDASSFEIKRVLAQPAATNYLLFSSGKLILAQKDSTNNLDFRAVDPGALLTGLKLNGDAISELYPLQFSVDGGTVANATASVDILATPALADAQLSGDVGTVPLAVGKNTLSILVKNTTTGNTQTYTVTITRAAKDFPVSTFNAFKDLGFVPADFVLAPDNKTAYLTASGGYSLFCVDMSTGKITEKQFTLPAEKIVLKNGNIYVTLLRSGHFYSGSGDGYGAIAVIDSTTLATKAIFNTNIDPYDIEADNTGNIYLASGSDQWSILASYDGNTGAFISKADGVYFKSSIELNPVSGKLYSVTRGLSPAQTYAYEISNGAFVKTYESPNRGSYGMSAYMKVSPDGKYIFNGSGCIFTSTPTQTGDMVYVGTLGSSFTSICFNLDDQEVYTANGKTLTVYDYGTRAIKNVYTLADTIVNMAYSGGKFTLLQQNANQQYYVRPLTIDNQAADLASLGASAGTLSPSFDSKRLSYSLVLPAGTASVTVSPVTLDSDASFTIDGSAVMSKTLAMDQGGTASMTITVQSQDKALLQSYTLFVYRQTADRTLLISSAFFTPTQQISAGGALYLAAKGQPFLYKFDGATGIFSALPLPGIPNALGCAGSSVFAAMESTGTNTFSIGVIDTGTFTLTDTFAVDTRFTGVRGDDDTIYAFTSSVVKGYARSNHQLSFSKTISSIVDVQPNPQDGMVYIAASYISSYSVKNGQLTLMKTNSNCSAQAFSVMPDGMHLVLPSGTVLRCSGNVAYDLMPETITLPNGIGSVAVDSSANELYAVDKYMNNSLYQAGSYLVSVYDASDFSFKRTISDPTPLQSILCSSGIQYIGQKDSKGNIVLRSSFSDAQLQAIKVNGDVKDGLYPLRSAVDAGEVPASVTSADIAAVATEPGDVITGDIGKKTLDTGKNEFSITVTNPDNGHRQTYSVTVTRRSSDPSAADARVNLGFTPLDVALDPDRSVEYMTTSNCKSLYRVDLQTGLITEKTFSVPVERLTMANGTLYATLLRTGHNYYGNDDGFGAVAVIDTTTFNTKAVVSTNIDPYDLAVDDSGNVYLAPGSAQWSVLASYNSSTGRPLSVIKMVFNDSYIDRNSVSGKIYLVTTNVSPTNISAFETSDGYLKKTYDSPDNGDYAMSSYERVSPDGTRIFNGAGTMFACKSTQTGDMTYLGKLGTPFTSICFDLSNDRFYTANNSTMTVYEYSTMTALKTVPFTDSIVNLQYDGTMLIAVQKNNAGHFYTSEINPDLKPSQYSVSFNSEGGSSVANQTIVFNSLATKPDDPTQTGYTFVGWYKEDTYTNAWNFATDKVTKNTTLFAKWVVNSYTVTFNSEGGSSAANQTIVYNSLATKPDDPTQNGYTFVGWYKEETYTNAWNFTTDKVTKNTTLFAKWAINSYTVTFNSEGGSSAANQTIVYNSLATEPDGPTQTGYTFAGWYKEDTYTNAWNFATDKVTKNTTLFAKWTSYTYTVTFISEGGSGVANQTIAYNSLATKPDDPTKTGYTFVGWYKEETYTNAWNFATEKVTKNTTIYAKWAVGTYTVTFSSQGGSSVANQTIAYNNLATKPDDPTKTGYTFAGWYKEETYTNAWNYATDKVTKNTTIYAKWTINTYTMTFNSEGGSSVASQTIAFNKFATKPGNPTKTGNTFAGWYKDATYTNAWNFTIDKVTTNVTIYAKWTVNICIVIFNSQGGSIVPAKTAQYGATITAPTAPTRTGCAFIGWFTTASGGTKIAFPYHVETNVTLYAQWSVYSPTNLCAISVSNTSIQLTWTAASGVTGYAVIRSQSSSFTNPTTILVPTNTNTLTDTGLAIGTTYYYKVCAYSGTAKKLYSTYTATIKTTVSTSYTSAKLTWGATGSTTYYEISRATAVAGPFTVIGKPTSCTFTDNGLTTGATYYYRVRSYNGTTKAFGPYITIGSIIVVPAIPTGVGAVRVSSTSIKVSWATLSEASGYEISRATTVSGAYKVLTNVTTTSYANGSLTSGTTYFYRIRAYKLVGTTKVYGDYSDVVSAIP